MFGTSDGILICLHSLVLRIILIYVRKNVIAVIAKQSDLSVDHHGFATMHDSIAWKWIIDGWSGLKGKLEINVGRDKSELPGLPLLEECSRRVNEIKIWAFKWSNNRKTATKLRKDNTSVVFRISVIP